jgi:hypothetical protein
LSFWAKFNGFEAQDIAQVRLNDGISNPIKSWVDGDDDNTWRYYEFNVTGLNPTCNLLLVFDTNFDSQNDFAYYDDIRIHVWKQSANYTTGYEYQIVRGSGEVHVIDPVSTIINGSSLLDEILWNFQFDRDNPKLLSNHDYCVDNMTLGKTLTFEYCVGANCRIIQRNETIPCDYGCNQATNSCNANPFVSVGIILLLILGFSVFIWEVLKRT